MEDVTGKVTIPKTTEVDYHEVSFTLHFSDEEWYKLTTKSIDENVPLISIIKKGVLSQIPQEV